MNTQIHECDAVITLYDKQHENGFIPKRSIGYVVFEKNIDNKDCYILEINGVNNEDPLFVYNCNEVVKISPYLIYQLMWVILNSLYDEDPDEKYIEFLSDYNPYIWAGECSGDPACYEDFKEKFLVNSNYEDYGYEFIKEYITNLDYYMDTIVLFSSIDKEDYLLTCDDILKEHIDELKH